MLKNGTPASPATARASRVLPVPGGPTRRQPRGIFAPRDWYLAGFCRKSLISCISSTASSTPATSEKCTSGCSSTFFFAFALPNDICELLALFIWLKKNSSSAAMMIMGSTLARMEPQGEARRTLYWMLGLLLMSWPSESEPTQVQV